ncbi:hypothetical protein EMCRGX_G018794 [Ephydatia muelleri]
MFRQARRRAWEHKVHYVSSLGAYCVNSYNKRQVRGYGDQCANSFISRQMAMAHFEQRYWCYRNDANNMFHVPWPAGTQGKTALPYDEPQSDDATFEMGDTTRARIRRRPPTASQMSSPKRQLTPAPAQMYTSIQKLEISQVTFTQKEPRTENFTSWFCVNDCEALLRRGNTLVMKIVLSSALSGRYTISLTFVPSYRPRDRFGQFRAKGVAQNKSDLWLSIEIPPNFPVGKYNPHISIALESSDDVLTHFHSKFIIVLFNPWNTGDDAYVEDEAVTRECLTDDVGTIWRGTHRQMTPLLWEYGQYEESCLEAALSLLQSLTADECRSASSVSRAIVARVNSRDGMGVLLGSFAGKHASGMHPCRWNGSAPILQRFYRTKTPVRYGQCWVFAGVVVTLLRALGVASRCVTCYEAAHQSARLMHVDRYFTADGDLIHDASSDNVWLYHVWTEAWMRRSDLPSGYDGWQVLDACSSERLGGTQRIGPCSVVAVKEGLLGKQWPYDGEFVQSEINSEIRYHRVTPTAGNVKNAKCVLALVQQGQVGLKIITATSKRGTPADITENYRHELIDSKAHVTSANTTPVKTKGCTFELCTSDEAALGDNITLNIKIHNSGSLMRTVDGRVVGKAVYYTGAAVKNFMSMEFAGVVAPGKDSTVTLPIAAKSYMKVLTEQCLLQFFLVAKVRESKQLYLKPHNFQLCPPRLEVECPASINEGSNVKVKLKFKNVLFTSLSRLLFLVQAQGLCPQREIVYRRLALPGGVAMAEFSIKAQKKGKFIFLASMSCDQLADVRGWAEIDVVPVQATPTTQTTPIRQSTLTKQATPT